MESVHEVHVANFVTSLNRTTIYEWYVVMCDYKNGYQKYMCLEEIGLLA